MQRIVFFVLLLLAAFVAPAEAARKLALVIGINDYREVPKLEKAVGDAKAIGEALSGLGFQVTTALNVDRRGLNLALSKLYASIEPGDTVLVQYSGHGVQIENDNYLLPADVPAPDDGSVELLKSESLRLLTLVDTLTEKGAGATILIIDACRDNPFAKGGKRSIGGTRGLANVSTAKGTFIMYSAGAGQAALDRLGDNDDAPTSVYTRVLLSRLKQPGMKLRDLAASVRDDVEQMGKSVGHDQRPAYYDDLSADFSLLPGDAQSQKTEQPSVQPVEETTPPKDETELARQAWEAVKDSSDPGEFDIMAERYAGTFYGDLAKNKAKALRAKSKQAKIEPAQEPRSDETNGTSDSNQWGVILGSFKKSETSKARARLKAARAEGYDAQLINTDIYGRLTPGLYAVVINVPSRNDALNLAAEIQSVFGDAFAKQLK